MWGSHIPLSVLAFDIQWCCFQFLYTFFFTFRSRDDVSRVITFAKLNEEDLLPVTQVTTHWQFYDFISTISSRCSPLLRPFAAVTWNCWKCLHTLPIPWLRERCSLSGSWKLFLSYSDLNCSFVCISNLFIFKGATTMMEQCYVLKMPPSLSKKLKLQIPY